MDKDILKMKELLDSKIQESAHFLEQLIEKDL